MNQLELAILAWLLLLYGANGRILKRHLAN